MTSSCIQNAIIFCTDCGAPQPGESYNSGEEFSCDHCGKELVVEVFPALYRAQGSVQIGDNLSDDGEASCYYHPHKKAAVFCAVCGRFLCKLCEIDLSGRCLCPSCIEKGRLNEDIEQLVTRRTLHDGLALSLAILPMLFFPLTVLTAPFAIFIAIRHWKTPGSILPRSRVRFVVAVIIALAQITGWTALLVKVAM